METFGKHLILFIFSILFFFFYMLVTLIISNSLRVCRARRRQCELLCIAFSNQSNINDVGNNNCCHHILFFMPQHMDRKMIVDDVSGFSFFVFPLPLINSFQILCSFLLRYSLLAFFLSMVAHANIPIHTHTHTNTHQSREDISFFFLLTNRGKRSERCNGIFSSFSIYYIPMRQFCQTDAIVRIDLSRPSIYLFYF